MNKIATFQKISLEQYTKDLKSTCLGYSSEKIKLIYKSIKLPIRATTGSAGYDFFIPDDYFFSSRDTVRIPTGIRVQIEEGWVLQIYPRSSLGFKYRLQLDNTCGIIDSDYYYSDNEGHIWLKMTNNGYESVSLLAGDAFAQGIFLPYGITYDDNVSTIRNGGIGSTNKGA